MKPRRPRAAAFGLCAFMLIGGGLTASASNSEATNGTDSASIFSSIGAGAARLSSFVADLDDELQVSPGTLDDGKELLPLATLTIDEAIQAAQTAASGAIGEVDLEYYQGVLVFNVDVGDHDVKVDAASGKVLAAEVDD